MPLETGNTEHLFLVQREIDFVEATADREPL